jgi:hypothetical protein
VTRAYGRLLLIVASVVVAVAIGAAFMILGSPADERVRRTDERRVSDLQHIARAADRYWMRHQRLAVSIGELASEDGPELPLRDPETAQPYEYRALGGAAYEVCAGFARASTTDGGGPVTDFWVHGADRQCFRREADDKDRIDR